MQSLWHTEFPDCSHTICMTLYQSTVQNWFYLLSFCWLQQKKRQNVCKKRSQNKSCVGHTDQLSCGICLICRLFRLKNWSFFWPEWNRWWVLYDCVRGLVFGTVFFSGQRGRSVPPGSDWVVQRRHQWNRLELRLYYLPPEPHNTHWAWKRQ